jgi:hypothetical protein
MIVLAMCAGCLSRERAGRGRRSELSIINRRGVIADYPNQLVFGRLIPQAGFEGQTRLRLGPLNAHDDHLNASYWDQRGVGHSAPADIPCAADAPDLGLDTNSLKREYDELVNRGMKCSEQLPTFAVHPARQNSYGK